MAKCKLSSLLPVGQAIHKSIYCLKVFWVWAKLKKNNSSVCWMIGQQFNPICHTSKIQNLSHRFSNSKTYRTQLKYKTISMPLTHSSCSSKLINSRKGSSLSRTTRETKSKYNRFWRSEGIKNKWGMLTSGVACMELVQSRYSTNKSHRRRSKKESLSKSNDHFYNKIK